MVAAGAGASTLLQRLPPPARRLDASPVVDAVLSDPGSPRAGPADADVTVVVFTDYLCGICRATDGALARLAAADPGVAVIYKDWPIRGVVSEAAARAALAAASQGGYLAMHRALMTAPGRLDAARLPAIAESAGLDPVRLARDLETDAAALDRQLARHAAQAFSLGLQGTPAYLVGPWLSQGGLDDRQLATAVRRARNSTPMESRKR